LYHTPGSSESVESFNRSFIVPLWVPLGKSWCRSRSHPVFTPYRSSLPWFLEYITVLETGDDRFDVVQR